MSGQGDFTLAGPSKGSPYQAWKDDRLSEVERSLALVAKVRKDIDDEAYSLDGTPFDGTNVAKRFGELMAEVQALAVIIEKMLNREKEATR